jgi:hypothetical protein
MNYYKQIAEMLGLELGQEFRIIGSHEKTIDDALFEITEDGLFSKANNLSGKVTLMLDLLLSGKYKAVAKPWKLEVGKQYFFYSVSLNRATTRKWCNGNYDLLLWKFGNCFKTEKEANEKGKEVMEAIHKEYEEA